MVQWKRKIQTVGIIIGVYLGFRYVLPIMIPFLMGWLLALCFYPVGKKAAKWLHLPQYVLGGTMIVLAVAGAGVLLWLGIEEGLGQLQYLFSHYEKLEAGCIQMLNRCCALLEEGTGILQEHSRAFLISSAAQIREELARGISLETVGWATGCMKGVLLGGSSLVIAVISGILILRDMEALQRSIREYPLLAGCRRVLRRLKTTAVVYLKAQVLILILICAECTVAFWLLGSPYYLLLGVGLGLMDALPLIGTSLFLYPAAVFFFLWGKPGIAVGCVALVLLCSVTREFLEPRLIGEKLGVYPVVILGAVYLGMVLYGPAGVLLGPLSFYLMYELGREWDVWE